jgi:thiol-disulfide isomerase/thioredoxin
MGKIMNPVNVDSLSKLNSLDERIMAGPITLVFVYADWCGHCQRLKPMIDDLENTPNRTVQIARVRDDVFPKSSLNRNPINGYPTVMLVDKKGNAVTQVEDYKNETLMNSIVKNAGSPSMVKTLNSASAPSGSAVNLSSLSKNGINPVSVSVTNSPPPNISANVTSNLLENPKPVANEENANVPRSLLSNKNLSTLNRAKSITTMASKQQGGSLLSFLSRTGPVSGLLRLKSSATRKQKQRSKGTRKHR